MGLGSLNHSVQFLRTSLLPQSPSEEQSTSASHFGSALTGIKPSPNLLAGHSLTPALLSYSLKLQAIHRFTSTADAVEDMTSIGEGKVSKSLKKFLTEEVTSNKKYKNEKLVVSEPKLGGAIAKKLELAVVSDSSVNDLYRGIRTQLSALLGDVDPKDISTMELGLSHSVSRCVCRCWRA